MRNGIENIIFDMGNVIVRYEPELFLDRFGISDEGDRKIAKELVYGSKWWKMMDRGELDEEGMIKIVEPLFPEHLKPLVRPLIKDWCKPLIMIDGIEELIGELKAKGYGIYLLSNASTMQKEYWPKLNVSKYFDGIVVSAYEKLVKPDERIYRLLLERYGLKAEKCLFIDDMKANIEAAAALGLDTFFFEGDSKALKKYLEN